MYITVTRARNRHETIRLRTKRTVNENAEEWKALLLAKRENREIDGGIIWVQRVGCNVEKLMVCELNPILSWKRNQIRFLTDINKILTIQASRTKSISIIYHSKHRIRNVDDYGAKCSIYDVVYKE